MGGIFEKKMSPIISNTDSRMSASELHACDLLTSTHGESTLKNIIVGAWQYVFDHQISPLRHIPDVGVRHMILQILGWMWAVSFSLAIGSYTVLAASVLGHAVLIGAAAITVATYTVAATKPHVFVSGLGRRKDGEHE